MHLRVWRLLSAVLLGVVSTVLTAADARAQATPSANAAARPVAGEVQNLLVRGRQLETEHRWGDALLHYESALRQYPGDNSLERRADLAKIHYDLGRRYNDGSFRRALNTLGPREALDLYGEVLVKIQSFYVQAPNWKELVQRGNVALEVALNEPNFADRNHIDAPREQIDDFCNQVRSRLTNRPINNRNDAYDAVSAVAALAKRQLGLSTTAVALEYTSGAANGLDDYSTFLTSDQLSEVNSQIEGNFVGLGVELKSVDGVLTIVKVISGSPAAKGDVHAGDQILSVDGRPTTNVSTDQAADLLQGPEGSWTALSMAAPGSPPRQLRLRREHVEVPSVDDVQIKDKDAGVAYMKVTCFQKTTSRDVETALWTLYRQGMKSLIIDLRGNPGGLLTESVEVADKFVEQGVIVSTRGRNPQEDFTYSAHKAGTWQVPLVVLIDGDSASASEIFAGAIRDHQRGDIVGQRSYGKGSVQGIFSLGVAGSGLRLTTAKFYSPAGHPYTKIGVEPNILVQETARPTDNGTLISATGDKDAALAAALEVARQKIPKR